MHQNERVCVQIREEFCQHLEDWCQGVNIWKPQLHARPLLEKQQILEQMPVRCRGKEVKTRTPGISYSGMFKKPGRSFPCQKREREREKDIQRSIHQSRLLRVFRELAGQVLQGHWSQCQMWEQSRSDMSWEMTKDSRPWVANRWIQMPSEAVVSTHLNTSEEVTNKIAGEMEPLLFQNIPRWGDNIPLLCDSVMVVDQASPLVTFSGVLEPVPTKFSFDSGAFILFIYLFLPTWRFLFLRNCFLFVAWESPSPVKGCLEF